MDRILNEAKAIGKALQQNRDQDIETSSKALTTRFDTLRESAAVCTTNFGLVVDKFLQWSELTKDIMSAYTEVQGMCVISLLEEGWVYLLTILVYTGMMRRGNQAS
jgi:hypothetical protein